MHTGCTFQEYLRASGGTPPNACVVTLHRGECSQTACWEYTQQLGLSLEVTHLLRDGMFASCTGSGHDHLNSHLQVSESVTWKVALSLHIV